MIHPTIVTLIVLATCISRCQVFSSPFHLIQSTPMKLHHLSLLLLIFCLPFSSFASRKAKLAEGSLEALKGVKKMNIKFSYDSLTIGKDEVPNDEYVKNRKEELNEKEGGKGSTWAREWVSDRNRRYEPAFRDYFNKTECGIRVGNFPEEKYTMIFKSINLEPGYNVGVSRKNSLLTGEAWIVETANPSNVICKISIEDAPGSMAGFDFDNGERIKMSYVVAGNAVGELIGKEL